MKKRTKISIIIPMHNSQKYIKDAIESVYMQIGYFYIELIVIDDFSTDKSVEIVEDCFSTFDKTYNNKKISTILLKNSYNQGVAKSRNIGIKHATGNYIAFLDSDDIFSPYKLKKQLEYLKITSSYFVCTGRTLINENGISLNNYIKVPDIIKYKDLLKTNRICCSSVLIKSSVLKKYEFEHDEFHEDYYLWLRIIKDFGPAHGLNLPLLQSRMTKNGKSRNKIKSSIMHYNVYKLINLNTITSLYYFFFYIIYGLEKYYIQKRIIKYYIRQSFKMFTQYILLPFFYNINRWRKIDNNLVILVDGHHKTTPINMRLIKSELNKNKNLNIKEFYMDFSKVSSIKSLLFSIKFMKFYSKAKYVFLCDNFLPVASCRKKRKTNVIQLWHACGALKKFGYDSIDDIPSFYKGNVYKNYDFVTVSSNFCVDSFTTAMKQKNKSVQPLGISKTDYYFNQDFKQKTEKKFYREHKKAINKKIVLWAPTFRGKAIDPYIEGLDKIKRLEEKLEKANYYLISKLHPHHNKTTNLRTSKLFTEELITISDILITDYSSILFDFLLVKDDIILFTPDIQEYQKNRGFYFNYNDIPGVQINNVQGIYDYIVTNKYKNIDKLKLNSFREKFLSNCIGNSTKNIINSVGISKRSV